MAAPTTPATTAGVARAGNAPPLLEVEATVGDGVDRLTEVLNTLCADVAN